MKKYSVLIAGIASQVILGSIYAWSELAVLLSSQHDLTLGQTQTIFGLAIGVFALGTIPAGRNIQRLGPRKLTFLSAFMFALAYGLAGLVGGNVTLLMLLLGPVLGLGIAAGYVVPLRTATAWFPHIKGTVTGLAVMGFGGGAIIASWLIRRLSSMDIGVSQIFPILGLGGAVVLALAAFFQSMPPAKTGISPSPSETASSSAVANSGGASPLSSLAHLSPAQLFRRSDFWILYSTMFLATFGGLIVIGAINPIAIDLEIAELAAALAVSALALGNTTGRLFWGGLIDRLGALTITLCLAVMALGFGLIVMSSLSPVFFLPGVFLSGFQFGASLVVFGAFCESYFGSGAISRIYPFIFTAYGFSALVGPSIGGLVAEGLGSFLPMIGGLIIVPVMAALIYSVKFLRKQVAST